MKRSFVLVLFLCLGIEVFGQTPKPAIDIKGPKQWTRLGESIVSGDGKFVFFAVDTFHYNYYHSSTVTLKSTKKNWQKIYRNATPRDFSFSSDSKYAYLELGNDARIQIELTNGRETRTRTEQRISNTIIKKGIEKDLTAPVKHLTANFPGKHIVKRIPSDSKDRFLFVLSDKQAVQKLILYDQARERDAILMWSGHPNEKIFFDSKAGNVMLFKVQTPLPPVDTSLAGVDVLSYVDSVSTNPFGKRRTMIEAIFAIDVDRNLIKQVAGDHEAIAYQNRDFIVTRYSPGQSNEQNWNPKSRAQFYIFSYRDFTKKHILTETKDFMSPVFSPKGDYLVFGDSLQYYSIDIKSLSKNRISGKKEICIEGIARVNIKALSGILCFINDRYVIVRDEYDLWKLDVTGKDEPINLTQGYGRQYKITFYPQRIDQGNKTFRLYYKKQLGYIINAYNDIDKSWGFYTLKDLNGGVPRKLYAGQTYFGGDDQAIKKASDKDIFLVPFESASESKNLYVTSDFEKFERLSEIRPEKRYNWLTSEVIRWTDAKGRKIDGILYKPEDFDSTKKYPVVTTIYGKYTDLLNNFPDYYGDLGYWNYLPVTWLVSNGYLVFMPDLTKREQGKFLSDTYEMLVPGIKQLTSLKYVDSTKIGLQGSSWGGIQTNFIITQTNLFAAAYSGAGMSEYISEDGFSDQITQVIRTPGKVIAFEGLLSENPESYIKQAALIYTNRITTPLLLRHGKNDEGVAFYQSLQFFRALRRLQKKVWLLQYDTDTHGIVDKKNLDDMNMRISQFFDHYLKNKPAPIWMTKGISPDMRQVKSGLEADINSQP